MVGPSIQPSHKIARIRNDPGRVAINRTQTSANKIRLSNETGPAAARVKIVLANAAFNNGSHATSLHLQTDQLPIVRHNKAPNAHRARNNEKVKRQIRRRLDLKADSDRELSKRNKNVTHNAIAEIKHVTNVLPVVEARIQETVAETELNKAANQNNLLLVGHQ